MPDVTILHNPRCSNSRRALEACSIAGVELEVVRYLDEPLSHDALRELLTILSDPPSALVRRDPLFRELGLRDADVQTAEQVAAVLAAHPSLMQRPVLQRGGAAIIGRPPERVAAFLA
ncbi:MAG: ArsC/Spx/MgsR family protein [Candidatus Lutibacillus vidarii]|jgi:arsenate reductase|nr:ArsC/Spx/MgsR family protein [Dermatophilaceae bacterium]